LKLGIQSELATTTAHLLRQPGAVGGDITKHPTSQWNTTIGSSMALDMDIDLMGAQPALYRLYTQLAFIFPLPDVKSQSDVALTVTRGLKRLSDGFPWVSGQVINITPDSGGPPVYKIRPFESTPRLTIRNYEENAIIPTFAQMTDAGFPMSMMGEELWAPCPTLAGPDFDPSKQPGNAIDPAPVLLVQLSFIKGGLVLCINMQHNVCDMMGQAAIIGWLSKACSGKCFTEEELEVGNMKRRGWIPFIEEETSDLLADLNDQLLPPWSISNNQQAPTPDVAVPAPLPPECSWTYFSFSSSSLEALKDLATAELPKGFTGYISTDDALSAFIFRSILRARSSRLSTDICVTLARAVDARRYLHVHGNYPGILQNMTYTTYPLSTLMATQTGHIAAALRYQVDPETSDMARRTRSLVTYLSQSPDHASHISFTARIQPDKDIMLSSWSKVAAYDWDFGLGLGTAAAVRRPGFVPVESLMYVMPKGNGGEITVAACLRKDDLDRLILDEEWNRIVDLLG
jgi:hypothetical protein